MKHLFSTTYLTVLPFVLSRDIYGQLPPVVSARGGGGGRDGGAPKCGQRFGGALLGRGHGKDLDSDSEYGEYPWHVGLLFKDGNDVEYLCGGALIDGRHVLTAAHCVKSVYPEEVIVRLGDWDVNSDLEPYEHQDALVSDIFIHERFFAASLHNDLALLRLEYNVPFSSMPQVRPVCLPRPYESYTGRTCWVTGWGQDAFHTGGELQARLQEVDVPIVRPDHCEASLRSSPLGRRFKLHPGWLCAGGEAGKDACSGDGGGPLVCQVDDEKVELAGLVSWGVGCGEQGLPGIYVNIANYITWIEETIQYKR